MRPLRWPPRHVGALCATVYGVIALVSVIGLEGAIAQITGGNQEPVLVQAAAGVIFIVLTAPVIGWAVATLLRWYAQTYSELSLVVEHSLDGIFLSEPSGRIHTANPAGCEMLGYTEDELRAGGRQLFMADDDPELQRLLKKRHEEGRVTAELNVRRKDGLLLPVEINSTLFRDTSGTVRTVLMLHDISERHHALRAARLAQTALENTQEGTAIVDGNWRIKWVNAAFEEITGFTANEVADQTPPFRDTLNDVDPKRLQAIDASLEANGFWQGELQSRKKDGTPISLQGSISRIDTRASTEANYLCLFADIGRIEDFENLISRLRLYDPLTGLPNRSAAFDAISERLTGRPRDALAAVLVIDIDYFQGINERFGHHVADDVLRIVAERVHGAAADHGVVARTGGDTFLIFVDEMASVGHATGIADALRRALLAEVPVNGEALRLSASIGIGLFPEDGTEAETLVQSAETALRAARRSGRGEIGFYEPALYQGTRTFLAISQALREAVEKRSIINHYQPIIEAKTGRIHSFEALARLSGQWRHIGPGEFIPVAEESGQVADVARRVFTNACADYLHTFQGFMPEIRIALNLSAKQFAQTAAIQKSVDYLERLHIDPSVFYVELTESVVMDDMKLSMQAIERMQSLGIGVLIDDFGTGYSSLAYLRDLRVDGLKIDKMFVQGLPEDSRNEAIVRTTLAMAHELGLEVVAEGVETRFQADYLRDLGCDFLQGFYFAKPASANEIIGALPTRRRNSG
ncbi:sensor domain-containing protein [Arhodomonas sp. AD133]|uniref:sensor domain-containing protein n=1 Tax=Arhodomonas sp. AD133 TaxID=3415009 RepID=UPI003EB70BCF